MQSSPFIQLRKGSSFKCRLLVFPGAGGHAHSYASWSQHLDPSIGLFVYEYSGHGRRASEKILDDFTGHLKEIVSAMSGYLNEPFVLVGESMGGLLAMEAATFLAGKLKVHARQVFLISCSPRQEARREK